MYKLGFYVPEQALEKVKSALFEVGAGHSGNYDLCCWQTLGQSQFRPLPRSRPSIGEEEKLSLLDEYRLEMVCEDHVISDVVKALKLRILMKIQHGISLAFVRNLIKLNSKFLY